MNSSESSGLSRLGRVLSRSMKSLIGAEKEEALVQVEMDSRSTNRKFIICVNAKIMFLFIFLLTRKISKVEIDLGGNRNVEKPPEARSRNVRELEQIYKVSKSIFNPCGETDQLVVHLNFAKNGRAKRS